MGKESKLIWYGVVAALLRSLFAVTPNWIVHGGPPKFAVVIPHSFLVAVPAVLLTWLLANRRNDYAWTFVPVCTIMGVVTALTMAATSPAWREMPDPFPKLVEMGAAYVVVWGLASGLSVALIGAIAKRSR
ncbi:MAG: hypothetical protein KIS66_07325 [Fimbriimonadaceae bacterium]|nr:hypothetical protein [Fimbriimonadaceae bacterium]